MSGTSRFTYLLLVGSFVLASVGAYLLLTQARDLTDARQTLDRTNRELAQRQSQLLVLTDALIAMEDQAKGVQKVSGDVGTICSHQENTNLEVRALCKLSEWATSSAGQFVAAYATAAAQRAKATSAPDWSAVRTAYAQLPRLLTPDTDPGQLWAARIQEGIAYSDYRLGKLNQADREVDRAYQLDKRSAFVGLTRLKVACARKVEADRILALYSGQRRNLVESARNPIPPMDKLYAGYELNYFDQDAEVRDVCAYARLPASS